MLTKTISIVTFSLSLLCVLPHSVMAQQDTTPWRERLTELAENPQRGAAHLQRNPYRNPVDTLMFFGIEPQMKVLELWPVRGWYTEIIAPFLRDKGQLTVAHLKQQADRNSHEKHRFWARLSYRLDQRITQHPEWFGEVKRVTLDPPAFSPAFASEQFDMVLSFRNVHIWAEQGHLLATMENIFQTLKPGGVFGMVEHRAARLTDLTSYAVEGYTDEAYLIAVAERVGFELIASSEINANPKDSKNYLKGVYTLPPTLALGLQDRQHYLNIGESDRMTLKFTKPISSEHVD